MFNSDARTFIKGGVFSKCTNFESRHGYAHWEQYEVWATVKLCHFVCRQCDDQGGPDPDGVSIQDGGHLGQKGESCQHTGSDAKCGTKGSSDQLSGAKKPACVWGCDRV